MIISLVIKSGIFNSELANPNQGIEENDNYQEDYIKNLICDNGSVKNIYLLKKIIFTIIIFNY